MTQISRNRILPIGAIALVLALGAIAVALATQSTDATSAPVEPPASQFDVLEPADAAAMEAVSEEAEMRLAFIAKGAELRGAGDVSKVGVAESPTGDDVTVAAVGEDICAFFAEGLGVCDTGQRAVAGQSFSAEPVGCDGYRVLGLAPDGVTSIAIDSGADGTVDSTLPVASNVYVGTLDPVQTVATGLDETGETRFSVGIPLDSYASMNEACE
jgi:hypothetical protein